MSNLQFGLSSYSYRWSIGYGSHHPAKPMNTYAFIEKAAYFGFSSVQICDNLPYNKLPVSDLQKLNDLAEKQAISIETGARGSDPDYLQKILGISSIVNSGLLRIVTEIDRGNPPNQITKELDQVIANIKTVLPLAKSKGIRLAIENHATLSSQDLLYIIQTIDDLDVGVCVDTMNSILLMEPPLETVQALVPYTLTVHLKDFRIEKHPERFEIIGVALGEGSVDFSEVLRILSGCSATPTMHVELYIERKEDDESTLAWEDECVRKSIRYLRALVGNGFHEMN